MLTAVDFQQEQSEPFNFDFGKNTPILQKKDFFDC
jgi:hypothetical protein